MQHPILPRAALSLTLCLGSGCSVRPTSQSTAHSTEVSQSPPAASSLAPPSSPPARVACDGSAFSGAETYANLQRLVALERYYGAKGRPQAVQYLQSRLAATTDRADKQEFSATETMSGVRYALTNIIGHQNASAKRRELLASHWDTRLWAEEDSDRTKRDKPVPYANDGGSGIAVLLELSRHSTTLKNLGVDYVFFDGEEFGRPGNSEYCKGSQYFAQTFDHENLPPPQHAIVLDMVGDADLGIYYEGTSLQRAPELTKRIWRTAKALGINAFHPSPKFTILDDHTSLQAIGIPAVLLIDYDYPYWHTHDDTLDKVSPQSLEAVGRVLLAYLCELDQEARP